MHGPSWSYTGKEVGMYKGSFLSLLVLFCVSTFCGVHAVHGQNSERLEKFKRLGEFEPTFYRILDENSEEWDGEERTEPVLTPEGEIISYVEPSFKYHLDIEGSAKLFDGRVINIRAMVNGEQRYSVVKNAPYGLGEKDRRLIPYHTIAVDPQVIPLGTIVYIPDVDGIRLPTGEVHNGYFFAHDTGSAIKGDRIDIFVGFENDVDNTLTRTSRVDSFRSLNVYQVDDDTAQRVAEQFDQTDWDQSEK
jgi:3D (Asp-Asp-Asp) domain-containing protein